MAVVMVARTLLRATSCAGGLKEVELDEAAKSIHFAPTDARPIALAIVDIAGTVNGTTSTLDREALV